MIFTIVNVCSTPISFYTVERFGRRPLLIYGALGMLICQFLVAIIGVTVGFNKTSLNAAGDAVANNIGAVNAQVAFIAIFIFFFASTWGPGAWVLIGEIFPREYCFSRSFQSKPFPDSSFPSFLKSPSDPVVSLSPPPPTGSGTPSSLSSLPTWSVLMRVTSDLRSSSFGEVSFKFLSCSSPSSSLFPSLPTSPTSSFCSRLSPGAVAKQ